MKNFFLLIAALAFYFLNTDAQVSKDAILLGGDLSGYTQNQEAVSGIEYKNNSIVFSPLIGFATRQNLVQGGYLQIGITKIENTYNLGKTKTNNFGGGYFIRKYSVIKNNFYGFLQGNAGFSYYKNYYEDSTRNLEYKQTSIGIDLSPGLSFKVSKKLHLEAGLRQLASLNYQISKNNSSSPSNNDILSSKQLSFYSSLNNFTSNLYFGFRLLLDKKETTTDN